MLIQPFDLPDPVVAGVVESAWGVAVESIEYAPVGFGSHHWRLSDGAQEWFVTVDVASFSGPLCSSRGGLSFGLCPVWGPAAARSSAQLQDPHEDDAETHVASHSVAEIVGRLT